jgi:hypothetical protein
MPETTSACGGIALLHRALRRAVVGRAGGAVQALAIGARRARRRAGRGHAVAHDITGGARTFHVDGGASAGAGRRHRRANRAICGTSGFGRQAPSQEERLGSGVGPAGGRRGHPGGQKRRKDLRPYFHRAQKSKTENHRELDLSFQRSLLYCPAMMDKLLGAVKLLLNQPSRAANRVAPRVEFRNPATAGPQFPARAPSFRTVFQLRPVPREPSFFSITVIVSFDSPMPSG